MSELERIIRQDMENEWYKRGYGQERLGNVNLQNDWMLIFLVAVALYLIWK